MFSFLSYWFQIITLCFYQIEDLKRKNINGYCEIVAQMENNRTVDLKTRFIAHIETWRPYTVIWCGLLSLTGACFTNRNLPSIQITLLSLFIPIIGWIAGLYLSDYLDKNLDTIQKAHRPIPSKRMKPEEALLIGGIFVLIGTGLTLLLGISQLLFVFLAGFLVFTYAKYTKSNGILGNMNRGLLAVVSLLFGVFAVTSTLTQIPFYILLLSILFFFHDVTTNIVGTLRDIEGDRKAFYNTIPVKYGLRFSLFLILGLIIIWFSLLVLTPFLYQIDSIYFYFMLILEILFIANIFFISKKLFVSYNRKTALDIHKLFVLERITLVSALLFAIVDVYITSLIYVVSLALTALFQYILRNQYEFNKWTL